MSIGFVKLHRKLINWEWYSDINTCRLFLHLILTAKFKDEKWRGIDIKRGQVLTGRISLAKSTSLTESQIRTAISKLKSTNEISVKITNEFSIITLTNYELYQSKSETNDQPNDQPIADGIASQSPANRQPIATDKEIQELKRIKEEKKLLLKSQFESFWNLYDKKVSRADTEKKFKASLKKDTIENIMTGLNNYIKTRSAESQYWKNPTTWLNQECWKDEYIPKSNNHQSGSSKVDQFRHL
jgi:hypothetical protein